MPTLLVAVASQRRLVGLVTGLCLVGFAGSGSSSQPPQTAEVFVVGRDGTGLRQLTHGSRTYGRPVWSSDGRMIASATSGVRRQNSNLVDTPGTVDVLTVGGALIGRIRPGGFPIRPAWLARRRLVFLARSGAPDPGTTAAMVVATTGGRVVHLASIGPVAEDVAWSPDIRTLAFVRGCQCIPPRGPNPDVVLVRSDGRGRRLLTRSVAPERALTWSPDGRTLSFTTGYSQSTLWSVSRDGSHRRRLGRFLIAFPAWAPDGRRLVVGAVTLGGDRRFHLYALATTGGRLREITGEVATQPPAWSPDGSLIAFVDAQRDAVETVRPDGSHRRILVRLPGAEIHDLSWSPTSHQIAFTAHRATAQECSRAPGCRWMPWRQAGSYPQGVC